MLHIAEPIIILSSLLQPVDYMPQKSNDHYVYESSLDNTLPPQNINDVITSEETLIHILKQHNFYNVW